MKRIAISGYASLDYILQLAGAPQPSRTVVVKSRPDADAWPRAGGSPTYIGAAIKRAGGVDVSIVTWIGKDAVGTEYLNRIAALGLATDGIARNLPGRTPICLLAYDPEGICYCFYEALEARAGVFTNEQLGVVESADWVCLAAQPPAATRAALDRLTDRQTLVWAVKGDADAFPDALRADVVTRANLIVHSRGERDFVAPFLTARRGQPDRLVVETLGADGAVLTINGKTVHAPLEDGKRIETRDPTGAGDTFLGGFVAALMAKPDDPVAAVQAGQTSARAMLVARSQESNFGAHG
jgi:ribokinase